MEIFQLGSHKAWAVERGMGDISEIADKLKSVRGFRELILERVVIGWPEIVEEVTGGTNATRDRGTWGEPVGGVRGGDIGVVEEEDVVVAGEDATHSRDVTRG